MNIVPKYTAARHFSTGSRSFKPGDPVPVDLAERLVERHGARFISTASTRRTNTSTAKEATHEDS